MKSNEINFNHNTKDFAYSFTENEQGLEVEIFHRHGELIKDFLIIF